MKVLHVAMRLDPAIGGSSASTTANIVAEARDGIDATVLFAAGADDRERTDPVVARLREAGARVVRKPRFSRPARPAAQFGLSRSAAAWLREHLRGFDVVHVHGPWGATSAAALTLARRAGRPTVLTAREALTTFDRDTSQSSLRAAAKTVAWRSIPSLVDVVVYTSELERNGSPVAGRRGSEVIWHAVFDEHDLPRPVRRDRDGTVRIGFLGRIDVKKNVDLLIGALAEDPRLHLVVGGPDWAGTEAGLREAASTLGVADRVQWRGYLDPSRRGAFFADVDVVALVSDYENFGMSAAEALGHGRPVVLSPRTGLTEAVRDQPAVRIVSLDAADVACASVALAGVADEAGFAAETASMITSRLSYAAHAQRIGTIYDALAAVRRAA